MFAQAHGSSTAVVSQTHAPSSGNLCSNRLVAAVEAPSRSASSLRLVRRGKDHLRSLPKRHPWLRT